MFTSHIGRSLDLDSFLASLLDHLEQKLSRPRSRFVFCRRLRFLAVAYESGGGILGAYTRVEGRPRPYLPTFIHIFITNDRAKLDTDEQELRCPRGRFVLRRRLSLLAIAYVEGSMG